MIGWIGFIAIELSCIPQCVKTYREGHAEGMSWLTLVLWLTGSILCLGYVIPGGNWPLVANYVFNIGIVGFILKYKMWPRVTPRLSSPVLTNREVNGMIREIDRRLREIS